MAMGFVFGAVSVLRDWTWSGAQMAASLLIDGVCSVRWWMTGQVFDSALSRYTMHAVVIEPPQCYRCFSCGLCGDFKAAMSVDGADSLETCHGGSVLVEPGYSGENAFAYDRYGNSWEYEYRTEHCPVPRGEVEVVATTEPIEFVPEPPPDFEWIDPCDSGIAPLVMAQCQRARDIMAACCASIGGDFCGTTWPLIFPHFFVVVDCHLVVVTE